MAKEGRLKRYQDRINSTHKTGHFKTPKFSSSKWGEDAQRHTNNQISRKQKILEQIQ